MDDNALTKFSEKLIINLCLFYRIEEFTRSKLISHDVLLEHTKEFVNEFSYKMSEVLHELNEQKNIGEAIKMNKTDEEAIQPTNQEKTSSDKLITPSGAVSTDLANIKKFEFKNNFSDSSQAASPKTTAQTLVAPDEKASLAEHSVTLSAASAAVTSTEAAQPTQQIQTASQITNNAAQTSNVNPLRPGNIPPANTPPANTPPSVQPAPVQELSRSTFNISANGKANVEYRGKITGSNANGKDIVIYSVDTPAELGLSFDATSSEIFGTPLQPGEFELVVHFQFAPVAADKPKVTGKCQLIINPDPKTLWKNLPSDTNDPYWKADEDKLFAIGEDGFSIAVASKRGRSHAHTGTCRDDDFNVLHDIESGWRVFTVADGAGSAKKSRKGSLIASTVATKSVLTALTGERGKKIEEGIKLREINPNVGSKIINEEMYYIFGNAAREAVQAIDTEAKTASAAYKEYSTTLIVTVHKRFEVGHFIGAYWVGDGGVGIYSKGQELSVLGKADSGEFAGQTRFLDMSMLVPQEIMNRIRIKIVQDFTAIVSMTDGITDPWFETDANIENRDIWDRLWSKELEPIPLQPDPAQSLLDWLDFWSPGNHDDRTIAIMYPAVSKVAVTELANAEVVE